MAHEPCARRLTCEFVRALVNLLLPCCSTRPIVRRSEQTSHPTLVVLYWSAAQAPNQPLALLSASPRQSPQRRARGQHAVVASCCILPISPSNNGTASPLPSRQHPGEPPHLSYSPALLTCHLSALHVRIGVQSTEQSSGSTTIPFHPACRIANEPLPGQGNPAAMLSTSTRLAERNTLPMVASLFLDPEDSKPPS